jgi:hypothetical protein
LKGGIKHFLIKWGRMGRVVGKVGLDWELFGEELKEKDFVNLSNQNFLKTNFDEEKNLINKTR